MPSIKLKHVCSVSSEDPDHPAENLLSQDTYRKWHIASPGEKQAMVVLQFEKASEIQSVDIGNDGSSFVEVLVARSSGLEEERWEVLLVASTFMSPGDSKLWTNPTRVRMFGKEKLSKSTLGQKWDKVKVICTQPFNKTEKYGLSFINLHSPAESSPDSEQASSSSSSPLKQHKLGRFSVKEEQKTLPVGSLFFKKDSKGASSPGRSVSLAVQARQTSEELLKRADEATASLSTKKQEASPLAGRPKAAKKVSNECGETPPAKKPKRSEDPTDESVPFNRIMEGVVFALSGFVNPYRGELREKAKEMGAVYAPDWNPDCSHLICAFANTPKYNQVKASKGMVVKKEWLLDSYKSKKRKPSHMYRFTSNQSTEESNKERDYYKKREEEIFKKTQQQKQNAQHPASPRQTDETTPSSSSHKGGAPSSGEDSYGGSTDEAEQSDSEVKMKPMDATLEDTSQTDEYDTEDEIERIRQKDVVVPAHGEDNNVPDSSEAPDTHRSLTDLPDFFDECHFFLYGQFLDADRQLIVRYIVAYAGKVEEYMGDAVTHIVTNEKWDPNFDQALTENSSLTFVRPDWIFACHHQRKRVPSQRYLVLPPS